MIGSSITTSLMFIEHRRSTIAGRDEADSGQKLTIKYLVLGANIEAKERFFYAVKDKFDVKKCPDCSEVVVITSRFRFLFWFVESSDCISRDYVNFHKPECLIYFVDPANIKGFDTSLLQLLDLATVAKAIDRRLVTALFLKDLDETESLESLEKLCQLKGIQSNSQLQNEENGIGEDEGDDDETPEEGEEAEESDTEEEDQANSLATQSLLGVEYEHDDNMESTTQENRREEEGDKDDSETEEIDQRPDTTQESEKSPGSCTTSERSKSLTLCELYCQLVRRSAFRRIVEREDLDVVISPIQLWNSLLTSK